MAEDSMVVEDCTSSWDARRWRKRQFDEGTNDGAMSDVVVVLGNAEGTGAKFGDSLAIATSHEVHPSVRASGSHASPAVDSSPKEAARIRIVKFAPLPSCI